MVSEKGQNETQAWLAVSYLQISKKHPLHIFIPSRQILKKQKKKKIIKKNEPIKKHKSTVLQHVFHVHDLHDSHDWYRTEWRVPNTYLIFSFVDGGRC